MRTAAFRCVVDKNFEAKSGWAKRRRRWKCIWFGSELACVLVWILAEASALNWWFKQYNRKMWLLSLWSQRKFSSKCCHFYKLFSQTVLTAVVQKFDSHTRVLKLSWEFVFYKKSQSCTRLFWKTMIIQRASSYCVLTVYRRPSSVSTLRHNNNQTANNNSTLLLYFHPLSRTRCFIFVRAWEHTGSRCWCKRKCRFFTLSISSPSQPICKYVGPHNNDDGESWFLACRERLLTRHIFTPT